MKRGRRGFTLVELLTVIAIISILYAIMLPVAKSVRAAAFQYNASNAIKQINTATILYATDYDDQCPPAYYWTPVGFQTWFGRQNPAEFYEPQEGLLISYTNGRTMKDPTHYAKEFLGDRSGFGYNWGQIGSDAHMPGGYTNDWGCWNPARMSEVSNPSNTVFWATSAIMKPSDHQVYDFGFIYEPSYWHGNPPVDFRHQGARKQDPTTGAWFNEGLALVAMGDGRVKSVKQGQLRDQDFMRFQPVEIP